MEENANSWGFPVAAHTQRWMPFTFYQVGTRFVGVSLLGHSRYVRVCSIKTDLVLPVVAVRNVALCIPVEESTAARNAAAIHRRHGRRKKPATTDPV
jgi:hypothetical protein